MTELDHISDYKRQQDLALTVQPPVSLTRLYSCADVPAQTAGSVLPSSAARNY